MLKSSRGKIKSVTLKLYTEKHAAWSALALAAKIKTLIQARRENTAQIKRPQRPSFESATQGWMQQRSLQSQLWSEAAAADDLTGNICNSQISSTYISVSPSPFCTQLFTWCHHFTVWWTVMVFNNIQSNSWVCFADLLSKRDNQIHANMRDSRTLRYDCVWEQKNLSHFRSKAGWVRVHSEVLSHL